MPTLQFPIPAGPVQLRPFHPGDIDDFYAYWSRPDVARFVPWAPGDPAEATVALARRIAQCRLEGDGQVLTLAVVELVTGRVIGETMLRWLAGDSEQGEIGFATHPDAQGRGLARAATRAVLELGFETVALHRIIGRCDVRNLRSARLMQRLGMRQEAHFRQNEFFKGEWTDQLVFALLAQQWEVDTDIPNQ